MVWTYEQSLKRLLEYFSSGIRAYENYVASHKLTKAQQRETEVGCIGAATKRFFEEFDRMRAEEKAQFEREIAKAKSDRKERIERELQEAFQEIRNIPTWKNATDTFLASFVCAVIEELHLTGKNIPIRAIPKTLRSLDGKVLAKARGVVSFQRLFNGREYDFYGFPHAMPVQERQRHLRAGRERLRDLLSGKTPHRAKKRGIEETAKIYQFMRHRFSELSRNRIASQKTRIKQVKREVKEHFGREMTYETVRRRCLNRKWGVN